MTQTRKMKRIRKTFFARMFSLVFIQLAFVSVTFAQQIVSGKVVDEANNPLIGASVKVKNGTGGTITNIDGDYTLTVPNANSVLIYSMMGCLTQEIQVGNKTTIQVTLKEDSQLLDEVVVVGFGSQKKVNLSGAITTVGPEVFERPVTNIGQALQGVVPNLNVTISNGGPNTVPSLNIRGGTTMVNSNGTYVVSNGAPLILVDGVEMSATLLNQMNPNDIDNMSVIKDASAAAIYGTKATFGVVLVTTKSGKFNQKGKISYSYDVSWDTPSALPDILDSYTIQLAAMNKTKWTGGSVSTADEVKLEAMQKYINDPTPQNAYYMDGSSIVWVGNMNPYDVVVRDWTPTQKHNLSISGGSDKTTYYISLGYMDQEGMYKINTDEYKRYNAAARFTAKVTDWFNVEAKFNYNQTNYVAPYIIGGKGSLWSAMRNEPDKNINMPVKTSAEDPLPNVYTDNILAWVSYGARTNTTDATTTLAISPEFIIVPHVLKVKADLSYLPQSSKSTRRSPYHQYIVRSWSLVSEQSEAAEHRGVLSRSSTDTYMMNIYADFNKTFGKHSLATVLGFNQESVEYGSQSVTLRKLFSPDIMKPEAAEDITLHTISTSAQKRTGRAGFGRITYNYQERYHFEVNGRYDGSSRFTKDDRYSFFPSYSLAWRISEEPFMRYTRSWLDNLKFRHSYGKLGSQPSGYYPYQAVMTSGTASFLLDGTYVTTVNVPGLVSPTLTWEKAATTNFAIDADFLRNRLNFSFDVFQRKTTDILTNGIVAYPSVLGASAPLENSGSIKTTGWELFLKWNDRFNNGLRYGVRFTLSDAQTKVLHYAANTSKKFESLYDGAIVGSIWGYETGGILQESDLVKNASGTGYTFNGPRHSGNLYPGYVWYRDINGDGQITGGASTVDDPGDRRIIGNSTPRYNYTITADLSYKGFDLNVFFQGVGKRDVWTGSSAYWGGGAGSQWMYDRSWTPEKTDARFPMYNYGAGSTTQTGYLIDGSYLRLKQMVLGYMLPQKLTRKIGVDKLRFHLSGYNLFEITDIPKVFEVDNLGDAYPSKRTVAIGVQIGF